MELLKSSDCVMVGFVNLKIKYLVKGMPTPKKTETMVPILFINKIGVDPKVTLSTLYNTFVKSKILSVLTKREYVAITVKSRLYDDKIMTHTDFCSIQTELDAVFGDFNTRFYKPAKVDYKKFVVRCFRMTSDYDLLLDK
jgi:hypothetical protein